MNSSLPVYAWVVGTVGFSEFGFSSRRLRLRNGMCTYVYPTFRSRSGSGSPSISCRKQSIVRPISTKAFRCRLFCRRAITPGSVIKRRQRGTGTTNVDQDIAIIVPLLQYQWICRTCNERFGAGIAKYIEQLQGCIWTK